MAKMQWDDSLSVGVGLIDDQHKQLIQRLNDLAAAIDGNRGPVAVASTLSFLTDYTDYHFNAEEGLMLAQDYPGLAAQKAEHEEFRKILRSLDIDFETDGASTFLADQVNRFLITWLANHIRRTDGDLGRFLQAKGAAIG